MYIDKKKKLIYIPRSLVAYLILSNFFNKDV